jgi:glucose-6-phosphate isomerase
MDLSSGKIEIVNPGRLAAGLAASLHGLDVDAVVRRIWERDPAVWKPNGREISDRLGWLDAPIAAEAGVPDLEAFAASVRGEGFVRAVVLGMGGSSLAPEVFARSFPTATGGLELEILDTTEPGAVADAAARLDLRRTLFLVSSKSGSTAELVALLSFFYERTVRVLGEAAAGSRFVAITDPASPLEALAASLRFRRIFHGRSDIGGRFSALSAFGLLPAALMGIDLGRLLSSAAAMAAACRVESAADNPGALLGAVLGSAALLGTDKLTFLVPPRLHAFAAWLEQLVAESTGKDGRGIVPVIAPGSEDLLLPGEDRLFVDLPDSPAVDPGARVRAVVDRCEPVVRVPLGDPYALGGHFFLWEFATAVAGHLLGIDPFDQPDVESTKKKTRQILAAADTGPAAVGPRSPGTDAGRTPVETLAAFLGNRRDGDYLAVLAFLPRKPGIETALSGLAERLGRSARLPVTVGFGPRYLHSTGQLHKGDGNKGLFLMLLAADLPEVAIPEIPGIVRPAPGFAGLFRAQARGDGLALAEKGRRVLTVELAEPLEAAIAALEPPPA